MNKIQRILVTGGAGFLGSHLCERLVATGHDVICLDNFFTSQKSNVAHLLTKSNFELIRHDITVPIYLEVDAIYNLACPAAPGHYQYNPIKTVKTSVVAPPMSTPITSSLCCFAIVWIMFPTAPGVGMIGTPTHSMSFLYPGA